MSEASGNGDATELRGTIARVPVGLGAWALDADSGDRWELQNCPKALQQAGLRAIVRGRSRPEAMTMAAIGPVFAVDSFEILE